MRKKAFPTFAFPRCRWGFLVAGMGRQIKSSIWVRSLGLICLVLIFYFLFRELWFNWTALQEYPWKLNLPLGFLSFAILTASLFFLPWALVEVLTLLGHRLTYRRMCRILFTSMMAKYLPGGWWAFIGRAHFYRQEGLNLPQASLAVLMETILVVTSGILAFSLFAQFPAHFLWDDQRVFLIFLGAACLALLHPRLLNPCLFLSEKLFKKPVPRQHYSYRKVVYPFFIFLLFWIGMGGSFWMLACSLMDVKLALLPQMISAFALSWTLGFLSFLTPGGLGVREGALTLLLKPFFPLFAATVLSLLSRVWWILGEILALMICTLWDRIKHTEETTTPKEGCAKQPLLQLPGKQRSLKE